MKSRPLTSGAAGFFWFFRECRGSGYKMASGGREPPDSRCLQLRNVLAWASNQGANAPRSPLSPFVIGRARGASGGRQPPDTCCLQVRNLLAWASNQGANAFRSPLSPFVIGCARWASGGREPLDTRCLQVRNFLAWSSNQGANAPRSPLSPFVIGRVPYFATVIPVCRRREALQGPLSHRQTAPPPAPPQPVPSRGVYLAAAVCRRCS